MDVTDAAAEFFARLGEFNELDHNGWRRYALCNQLPYETADALFFADHTVNMQVAKEFCKECPVINECLNWAFENDCTEGVWGGTTPADRGMRGAHRFEGTYYSRMNDGVAVETDVA